MSIFLPSLSPDLQLFTFFSILFLQITQKMNKSNKLCLPQNMSSQKFFVVITAVVNWRWIPLSATHLTRLYLYFIAIYEQIYLFNRLSFKRSISQSHLLSVTPMFIVILPFLHISLKGSQYIGSSYFLFSSWVCSRGNHDKSYVENRPNKDPWTCAKKLLK